VASLAVGEPVDPSWRVTLHFHPDRLVAGVPILERMARDEVYRSQFETGISSGGLTAYPGGDRWLWESRMFGGAYDVGPAADRPKYGSLNFRLRRVGGSPRFGSAHLRLAPHTLAQTTFCYPDSVLAPCHFGVASRLSTLIALAEADETDPLDDYVEAHVHGVVRFAADVEALVLDPCYGGTPVETAAARLGCPVEWHGGFSLTTAELRRHPDYRVRSPRPVPCPRRPPRPAHDRRRVTHRPARRADPQTRLALRGQVRHPRDARVARPRPVQVWRAPCWTSAWPNLVRRSRPCGQAVRAAPDRVRQPRRADRSDGQVRSGSVGVSVHLLEPDQAAGLSGRAQAHSAVSGGVFFSEC
jgi:hypothetical protein